MTHRAFSLARVAHLPFYSPEPVVEIRHAYGGGEFIHGYNWHWPPDQRSTDFVDPRGISGLSQPLPPPNLDLKPRYFARQPAHPHCSFRARPQMSTWYGVSTSALEATKGDLPGLAIARCNAVILRSHRSRATRRGTVRCEPPTPPIRRTLSTLDIVDNREGTVPEADDAPVTNVAASAAEGDESATDEEPPAAEDAAPAADADALDMDARECFSRLVAMKLDSKVFLKSSSSSKVLLNWCTRAFSVTAQSSSLCFDIAE
uniref:Uncharacterized protein LOC116946933 n=1 Tax=Petromyzon marinus TaxID=7757 RepID=A0AAJ7X1R0_PETMA|nr:uncharacterized protein LOC116946933 [Petromyzon marinus]